jgi:NAD(P)-dependent dehydrogenase (short-subunit alcohol dehydrogenase family)
MTRTASKAGLIALNKTLGRELAPENITVNAGVSLSEMRDAYSRSIPLGRIGRPDEIAAVVALPVRRELGAFVGQTIQINGGTTRCRV